MNLTELTEEQLAAELERRQKAKKEAEKQAKKEYEEKRNHLVIELVHGAKQLHSIMKDFKQDAVTKLEDFYTVAQKYGDVRGNSKGGFGLRSEDGQYKVVLERNTKMEYDERAVMGEKLIREFLADMVKKRDAKAYKVIGALLQRGVEGKYNPAAVAALVKMESEYDDPRWVKGIKLFKEAPQTVLISMSVSFYQKDGTGKDQSISLTFSSLPVEGLETEEETAEVEPEVKKL